MLVQSADAVSITLSSGREGPRPPGAEPGPFIILDFPYETAQFLAQHVLPHAKPEHVFAGRYLHEDRNITLGCYVVVPVATPIPTTYVIGNERNLPDEDWRPFWERFGEFGWFMVSCGIATGEPNGTYLTKPEWFLRVTTFHHEDIRLMVHRKIGLR